MASFYCQAHAHGCGGTCDACRASLEAARTGPIGIGPEAGSHRLDVAVSREDARRRQEALHQRAMETEALNVFRMSLESPIVCAKKADGSGESGPAWDASRRFPYPMITASGEASTRALRSPSSSAAIRTSFSSEAALGFGPRRLRGGRPSASRTTSTLERMHRFRVRVAAGSASAIPRP